MKNDIEIYSREININKYLFISDCAEALLLHGFSPVALSQGYSSLWRVGFSRWWLLLAEHRPWSARASVVEAHGFSSCSSRSLEHRLSSYGERD